MKPVVLPKHLQFPKASRSGSLSPGPYIARLVPLFILGAGSLLLASGLIRLLNAAGHAQILALPDPLLGIPLRLALALLGALELAVALFCLLGKRPGLQAGWLAWLGLNYFVYRLGLLWMNCHPQCTCLGNPLDPLHLPPTLAFFFQSIVPIYLLAGSFATLLWCWRHPSINPNIHQSINPNIHQSNPGESNNPTSVTLNPQLSTLNLPDLDHR